MVQQNKGKAAALRFDAKVAMVRHQAFEKASREGKVCKGGGACPGLAAEQGFAGLCACACASICLNRAL